MDLNRIVIMTELLKKLSTLGGKTKGEQEQKQPNIQETVVLIQERLLDHIAVISNCIRSAVFVDKVRKQGAENEKKWEVKHEYQKDRACCDG